MKKQRLLNWIGGIWFVINLPIIPFAGSAVYGILGEYFFNPRLPFALTTFGVFTMILLLSKVWVDKYINTPVILSLIIFLYASLQLIVIQDFLVSHRPILFGLIFVVLVCVICISVVKAMRGELTK